MRGQNIILASIKKSDKVIDVGGAFYSCARADYVIDIMPWEYADDRPSWPKGMHRHFTKETYIQRDLCTREALPFKNNEFDFVICSQILEDLRDPLFVCSEIVRIGKRGWIETPSRYLEQTYWGHCVGFSHHRWLVEIADNKITFTFKPHILNTDPDFFLLPPPRGLSINPKYEICSLLWTDSFDYYENILINNNDIRTFLSSVQENAKEILDLWISSSCIIPNTYGYRENPKKIVPGRMAVPNKMERWLMKVDLLEPMMRVVGLARSLDISLL